jgi:hypothetical protein
MQGKGEKTTDFVHPLKKENSNQNTEHGGINTSTLMRSRSD